MGARAVVAYLPRLAQDDSGVVTVTYSQDEDAAPRFRAVSLAQGEAGDDSASRLPKQVTPQPQKKNNPGPLRRDLRVSCASGEWWRHSAAPERIRPSITSPSTHPPRCVFLCIVLFAAFLILACPGSCGSAGTGPSHAVVGCVGGQRPGSHRFGVRHDAGAKGG
mgnify:CR=1 FL=1